MFFGVNTSKFTKLYTMFTMVILNFYIVPLINLLTPFLNKTELKLINKPLVASLFPCVLSCLLTDVAVAPNNPFRHLPSCWSLRDPTFNTTPMNHPLFPLFRHFFFDGPIYTNIHGLT